MKKSFFLLFATALVFAGLVFAQNFSSVYTWMYENGLTTMTSEEAFRPNDSVTRGEIAKFFAKFAVIQGLTKSRSEEDCQFADIRDYDSSLVPYIVEACQYGLLKGSAGNYFPNKSLTEAEAITVVVRALMGEQDENKDPRWTSYYEVGKWVGILENEGVWDLNKNALRGKVATWLLRASQVDMQAAQQEGTQEVKDLLTEIFGETFRNE